MLKRRKARRSLLDFTRYTKADYEINWHHRLVCDALDRFIAGGIPRLAIFMPPRHGKSELVSRRLPAYIFGRNPDAQIIATSYSADLASRMNRDVQRIIETPEYAALFPQTRLNSANVRTMAQGSWLRNSDQFEIVGKRGSYRSAGVGGGITGMGFDFGIIDDPVKNDEEAASATYRDSVWEWYTGTFYTRREKAARILLTMTRWHEDDLAGRLLRQMRDEPSADQWTVIRLPALADEERADGDPRASGEALWPNKFSSGELDATRVNMGGRKFAALYQGTPRAESGSIFNSSLVKRIDADALPPMVKMCRRWDLAFSDKQGADYVTGAKLGVDARGYVYILHLKRIHGRWPQSKAIIVQTALDDGVDVPVLIEANGTQLGYYDDMRADTRMQSRTVLSDKPEGTKEMRASTWGSRLEDGIIFAVRGEWNTALFDEMDAFPNGAHDDQIDAISGAWNYVVQSPLQIFM